MMVSNIVKMSALTTVLIVFIGYTLKDLSPLSLTKPTERSYVVTMSAAIFTVLLFFAHNVPHADYNFRAKSTGSIRDTTNVEISFPPS